jgi:hypothetical protein
MGCLPHSPELALPVFFWQKWTLAGIANQIGDSAILTSHDERDAPVHAA